VRIEDRIKDLRKGLSFIAIGRMGNENGPAEPAGPLRRVTG